MKEIVKASETKEVLAVMGAMLGFNPENSLVLLPITGEAGNQIVGGARIDLPNEDADIDELTTWVAEVLHILNGVQKCLIIFYVNQKNGYSQMSVSLGSLMSGIGSRAGIEIREVITVTGEGFYTLDSVTWNASTITPISEVTSHPNYRKAPFNTVEEWRASLPAVPNDISQLLNSR